MDLEVGWDHPVVFRHGAHHRISMMGRPQQDFSERSDFSVIELLAIGKLVYFTRFTRIYYEHVYS